MHPVGIAEQVVVTIAAVHDIAAGPTHNVVRATIAIHDVGIATAVDPVIAVTATCGVIAGIAIDLIGPTKSAQNIVAISTVQLIPIGTAGDRVIAVPSPDLEVDTVAQIGSVRRCATDPALAASMPARRPLPSTTSPPDVPLLVAIQKSSGVPSHLAKTKLPRMMSWGSVGSPLGMPSR